MRKMAEGPLKTAIGQSRNYIAHRHAVLQYRENLAAAYIESKAWGRGGMFFGALAVLAALAVFLDIWFPIPATPMLGPASWLLSGLSIWMSRKGSKITRAALAGWPHPS